MRKNLLRIFILVALIISIPMANISMASPMPVISVEPAAVTAGVGETFTVNIAIADVSNLYFWEFHMSFNDHRIDTWTGDGETKSFVTSEKPVAVDSEEVYVNEYLCRKAVNYTIDYKTGAITFTVAPSLGAEIKAIYLIPSLIPPILEVVNVTEGPFLKTVDSTSWSIMPPYIDNDRGMIKASDLLWLYPDEGATGNGVLCSITFKVKDVGKTTLNFLYTLLFTFDGATIVPIEPHTVEGGLFTNVHDIAITNVTASPSPVVDLGKSVSIDVTVTNEGDFPETFDVTTQWNIGALHDVIETKSVTNLEDGTSTTLAFTWDTTGICTGTYIISAEASVVARETDTADNTFIYGEVTVFHPYAPKANFTSSPEKPKANEMVTFNASASSDPNGWIVSWSWDFNDGNVGDGQVCNHTYTVAGTYNVTLTVEDNDGLRNILWKPVKVLNYPVANFTYSSKPEAPLMLTFDASASTPDGGSIISYSWNFGDDTNGTGKIVTHTYAGAGNYKVTLNITDSEGLTNSTTQNVTIQEKHDVAIVSVKIFAIHTSVWVGESVGITIDVRNEGTETEGFTVNAYAGVDLVGSTTGSLAAGASGTYTISWTTTAAGSFLIKGEVPPVAGEVDTADNSFIDGKVTVTAPEMPKPMVYVDPPNSTVAAGETFTINVNVAGITLEESLYGWEAYISFDPHVIQAVNATEGPFLKTSGYDTFWLDPKIDNAEGTIAVGAMIYEFPFPPSGAIGSGVLAIVNFTAALIEGKSDLHFFDTEFFTVKENYSECEVVPIEHTAIDGVVHVYMPPPQHEIKVSLDAPTFLEPGDSTLLNASVYNKGLNNETNVELQLLIDGSMVDSAVIPELLVDSSYTLTYLWTPTAEGAYNVTAYALPVPGENLTANNIAAKLVTVTYPLIRPIEGQWANYTLCSFENDRLTGVGEWNITYDHYISPYLINVICWFKEQWGYNATFWMVVNIMNRQVETGNGPKLWYYGWIETNITIGSTINLLDSNATVVGSRIIEVCGYPVDCWELQYYQYYDYYEPYGISLWYDKVSGLLIGIESTADDWRANLTLVATNIPIGALPVASFTYSPIDPFVGEIVTFDASTSYDSDGTIISYEWDFGDGVTGSGMTTTHAYVTTGTYTVTLTVTDDDGLTNTAKPTVTVSRTTLEVDVDVGSIHFRGEIVEFYVLVSLLGEPTDANISATLYYSNGTLHEDLTEFVEHTATGLYRVPYAIPPDAPPGTYALVVDASLLTLKGTSLKSFILSETLTGWNALLISINGTVGTIKTDLGLIEVKLDDINATLISVERNTVTIQTDVGLIKADLDAVKARITAVDGSIATIQTTLGTINGTITSIQDDIATIETDIGTIESILEDWTGGTTSPITTSLGTFQMLVLTTSTLEGPIVFSGNVVAITLSGPSGTAGTTNVVIPKQLLVSIDSSIHEVVVTIDDEQVVFTYTEQPEAYVLQISYTHSAHVIKVYLAGLPPTLAPFPWAVFIAILVVAVIAVGGVAVYILKIRKPRVASGSRSTVTHGPTTLQP